MGEVNEVRVTDLSRHLSGSWLIAFTRFYVRFLGLDAVLLLRSGRAIPVCGVLLRSSDYVFRQEVTSGTRAVCQTRSAAPFRCDILDRLIPVRSLNRQRRVISRSRDSRGRSCTGTFRPLFCLGGTKLPVHSTSRLDVSENNNCPLAIGLPG